MRRTGENPAGRRGVGTTLLAMVLVWRAVAGVVAIEPNPARAEGVPRATLLGVHASEAVPEAAPLPPAPATSLPPPTPGVGEEASLAAPEPSAPDLGFLPGRTIQPIDLANTLRLAGARDLDIAIARQRVNQALAELSRNRALWLPSLFLGPTWYRADGQIQTVTGQVQTINRSALFLGGVAASPNTFAAPSPGTGYPPTTGMTTVLRLSDAIYLPMAARRVASAREAGVRTATNDALLEITERYFDLQLAGGRLAIAREAAENASMLADITGAYAKAGQGKPADNRRALAELRHQRKIVEEMIGRFEVASSTLLRQLVLDQRLVLAPVEPAELILQIFPDDCPLEDLIIQGLRNRPELAQSRELLEAAIIRVKQARMRPFIPSVGLTYAGGGFGGGKAGYFGQFGPRGDAAASLFWELQNLGMGDLAIYRRQGAERQVAQLELVKVETRVASEVASSLQTLRAAERQIAESRETVVEAVDSLRLNFIDIREGANLPRATRPIEVLQPIQALAQARIDYLDSVLTYNRAQFRLKRAVGQTP